MINTLTQSYYSYAGFIEEFFSWYALVGRKVLDVLYTIFDKTFDILLIITVLVSSMYLIMSIYILFKRRKKDEYTHNGELPFVTVQIPTYNEIVAVRCAQACLEFDYPKNKYEILIGDDSNKPEVSDKIAEFAKNHSSIKVIKRESNYGYKPGNLNNMLKHSKGDIITVFDSDFVPKEDFLRRIVQPFMKDEKIAGVQARWKFINANQNMIATLGAAIVIICHHIALSFIYGRKKITLLCGSAEAVRKKTLIELGGWDNGNLTEDIEFALRLLKNGYNIEYLEDLECDSEVPYTLKDLYRQQMRWAYGVTSSWKKHFTSIITSKHLSTSDKLYMQSIFLSGYLITSLLVGLFVVGTLSFITHVPEPINWGEFAYKLIRNIILTSGLIIAGVVALAKANKVKLTLPMLASAFSYGLVVICYVTIGIFKALAKVPMEWYMLNKQGNKTIA